MLGNHLFTVFFELARDHRPGIVRFDERAARVSKRLPPGRVAEQPDDGGRKIVWRIGGQEMAARFEREAFGADRRRDDRLAHRERLENLDARPAAGAQRHHVHGCLADRRAYIVDRARDDHAGLCGKLAHARAGIAADDRERRGRGFSADPRKDRVDEVTDRVFVRMPVHRAAEDKTCRHFGGAARLEVLGVHPCRYRRSADPSAKLRQPLFVIV